MAPADDPMSTARQERLDRVALGVAALSVASTLAWGGWVLYQHFASDPDSSINPISILGPLVPGGIAWIILGFKEARTSTCAFVFSAVVVATLSKGMLEDVAAVKTVRAEAAARTAWKAVVASVEATGKTDPVLVQTYVLAERRATLVTKGDRAGQHAALGESVLRMTQAQTALTSAAEKFDPKTFGDSRMFTSRAILQSRLRVSREFAKQIERSERLNAEIEKLVDQQMAAFGASAEARTAVLADVLDIRLSLAPHPEQGVRQKVDELIALYAALDKTWGKWTWTAETGLQSDDPGVRLEVERSMHPLTKTTPPPVPL
jgi:hypothetical protein